MNRETLLGLIRINAILDIGLCFALVFAFQTLLERSVFFIMGTVIALLRYRCHVMLFRFPNSAVLWIGLCFLLLFSLVLVGPRFAYTMGSDLDGLIFFTEECNPIGSQRFMQDCSIKGVKGCFETCYIPLLRFPFSFRITDIMHEFIPTLVPIMTMSLVSQCKYN